MSDIPERPATDEESTPDKGLPSLKDLFYLYFRPIRFFRSTVKLAKTPAILFITWIVGVSSFIDRLDTELLKAKMHTGRPGLVALFPQIVDNWYVFWLAIFVAGAVSAYFLWLFGGWWYNVRLSWCGAHDHDKKTGRIVYIYTSFIFALPSVLYCIALSAFYPNYRAAFSADHLVTTLLLVFPFWAVANSYLAVCAVFQVNKWKAQVWFLILPFVVLFFVLGVMTALVAFLGRS